MVLTNEATRFMHCGGALGRERLVQNFVSGSSVRVEVASASHVHVNVSANTGTNNVGASASISIFV